MGIKHFFFWYKQNFPDTFEKIHKNEYIKQQVDTLLLDLNGIFHKSSQKIYKYGGFKMDSLLLQNKVGINKSSDEEVYKDVCSTIQNLIEIVRPVKKVIMCIDGPGPLSKQKQQRQRRFKASLNRQENISFDSNCITPGTQFMHNLSNYIDNFIKTKLLNSFKFKHLNIIFSNEKVPGEGEHKAVEYIRNYGLKDETYCINGPDGDLIMLALATHKKNFFILRDDMYNDGWYFLLDIKKFRNNLIDMLKWTPHTTEIKFNKIQVINDFVFMCFILGNDFLPNIPSVEIIENGIEIMIQIYKFVCPTYGHLTVIHNKKVKFNKEVLQIFFKIIGDNEKELFENKLNQKKNIFPDQIMIKNSKNIQGIWNVDLPNYIKDYHYNSFQNTDIKSISHEYLQGLQWILTYYTTGNPSWNWFYKFHYAPIASVLSQHVLDFKETRYGRTKPSLPFQQLISVLPPSSSNLLPYPLNNILTELTDETKEYFPEKIEIDLSGKKQEWEGTVIIPMISQKIINKLYKQYENLLSDIDKQRNKHDFIYSY